MRIGTLCCGLVVLLPLVAQAQQPAPVDVPRVAPGAYVRVTEGATQHIGALRGVQATVVQLNGPGDSWRTFELARVERVEVRRRYTAAGVLIGGLVGAAGLGTFGALGCRNDEAVDDVMLMVNPVTCGGAGAVLGGVVGMGLGAVVGWSIQGWTTAWTQPPPR